MNERDTDMTDAVAYLDIRLRQDGITLDEEERARLIEMIPVTRGWISRINGDEARHAEPALTHRLP